MRFITIDFETATSALSSACELGLSVYEDGQITQTQSWLIRPPENAYLPFNIKVHGISPSDTAYAPDFAEVWEEVMPIVHQQTLFAHNASFDVSVLRACIQHYRQPTPQFTYACSVRVCRQIWPDLDAYNLKFLCNRFQIPLKHHRAGNDAEATARLLHLAFEKEKIQNFETLKNQYRVGFGKVYPGGFEPAHSPKTTGHQMPSKPNAEANFLPTHPFYGKEVVFSGQFQAFNKTAAAQMIWNLGGKVVPQVGPFTHYMIEGMNKKAWLGKKERLADRFSAQGTPLVRLTEEDFLVLLGKVQAEKLSK